MAARGPHQRRKNGGGAKRDTLRAARPEREQFAHLPAARRHQPIEILAPTVDARDAGAQGGAIVEARRERHRAFDIGAIEASREGAIINALLDQSLGDQDLVADDALFAGAPRRMVEDGRLDPFQQQKGDFRWPILGATGFKTPAAAI